MKRRREKEEGAEIIPIDGPAGAGKSTVGKMLARRLKYLYLDTGAMYRAVALCAKQEGIDLVDEVALDRLCRELRIFFRGKDGEQQRVICQGEDVTEKIREPEIGWMASTVSMKRILGFGKRPSGGKAVPPIIEPARSLKRRMSSFGTKGSVGRRLQPRLMSIS